MPLVLILSGLVPGLAAAGWALASGGGFLFSLGVYTLAGGCGMLCAAGLALARARSPAPRSGTGPAPWNLPSR
ncbi:hypothetical protein [Stagnihabitans tardus]|uniref:Uncharacterized protein n=1 Tax=Stagnihabitans tardus TaxID=2699202 RepID=A0AAE4YE75_9RHOB|nr:hypothetical protein [Stagnihabitans tardus]NBZ90032.1 hypothetical protein [Stagnihabitans tardus]